LRTPFKWAKAVADSGNYVFSVFEMNNRLGYFVPRFNFRFDESDTGKVWFISGGGTRCYIARIETEKSADIFEQAADSHFMMNRIVGSLLISGAGLFAPEIKGRLLFRGLDKLDWDSQIEMEIGWTEEVKRIHDAFSQEKFSGWLIAICRHKFLRRAVDDLVLALRDPTEAFVFIYRGFEWLEQGLDISKAKLAEALGVGLKDLKELGRLANHETGVRHATSAGVKMRANVETYSTWAAGLVDAINFGRAQLDSGFHPMKPDEVANILKVAVRLQPYA
jgi:hypothetical protein